MTTRITALACLLALVLAPAALAQDYGVGETVIVPRATDAVVIDGVIETDVWDVGANIDLLGATAWWTDAYPQDITDAFAQVLFKQDTLFIHVFIDDNELYTDTESPWQSDQLFIGIDPVHEAGVSDQLVDQDDWAGWPDNAPDEPHAYKIYIGENGGDITLNFDAGMAAQYVDGVVYTDEAEQDWGLEAAFYVPGVAPGAEIGFNIGGAQANAAACSSSETGGECAYGYFSRWSTENPGGDIYSRTDSYATLRMAGGESEGYGSGFVMQVPRVDPGQIVIDGQASEAAWDDAQMDLDATRYWNPYGPIGEATPVPDLVTETRLLWSQDTLYVYHFIQDIEIFWGGETGSFWNSDMILVGLDNTAAGDSLFDPDFGGGAFNAPDEGPHTYFINGPAGFTFAWNEEPVPADSGWVNGAVFVDEANLEWGFEAAFYLPAVEMNAKIGFDIGGAQASADQCVEGFCDYAYFSWQSGANGVDPGTINRDASQWALLTMVEEIGTAVEETPGVASGFSLQPNYPNPFRGTTEIPYALEAPGHVTLGVYDVLGRRVATLVDGPHAADAHRVTWDAGALPSGLYLVRLQVDGRSVATRTLTVMK